MTSKWLVVLLAVASAAQLSANGAKHEEVELPDDAEIVTITSAKFKITVETLNQRWGSVQEEAKKVESPRGTSQDKDQVIVNTDLFEKNEGKELSSDDEEEGSRAGSNSGSDSSSKVKKPRILSKDLYEWIVDRASHLSSQTEKYQTDLGQKGVSNDDKIILELLLLNTLVDLQNIVKEKSLKKINWIKPKLSGMQQFKTEYEAFIDQWVQSKIAENIQIERAHKGSTKPKPSWFVNIQALKRILHEQRFSEAIGTRVLDFLGGKYSMMTRGHLYEVNDKPNNEGLVYSEARRRIPPFFSFSAQYALVNGPRRLIIDKLLWFKTY